MANAGTVTVDFAASTAWRVRPAAVCADGHEIFEGLAVATSRRGWRRARPRTSTFSSGVREVNTGREPVQLRLTGERDVPISRPCAFEYRPTDPAGP